MADDRDLLVKLRAEPWSIYPELRDAADEIERLRAEVAHVHSLYWDCDGCLGRAIAERDKAKSELAALRERIEKAPVRETYVARVFGRELVFLVDEALPDEYKDHRVRLVRED